MVAYVVSRFVATGIVTGLAYGLVYAWMNSAALAPLAKVTAALAGVR